MQILISIGVFIAVALVVLIATRRRRLPALPPIADTIAPESGDLSHAAPPQWCTDLEGFRSELQLTYGRIVGPWQILRVVGMEHRTANRGELEFVFREIATRGAAVLVREPENSHDPNAIAVYSPVLNESRHIGYIPRIDAARLAPLLDSGKRYLCFVAAKLREGYRPAVRLLFGFVGDKYLRVAIKPMTRTAELAAQRREHPQKRGRKPKVQGASV